jgi:hypothetical protein
MKFNKDRNWLAKRAEQEDRHFISVGGLISRIDPEWQADVSSMPNVETTKTAFVRLLQLARRERRLSLEQLAQKVDVDLGELVKISRPSAGQRLWPATGKREIRRTLGTGGGCEPRGACCS